MTERPQGSLPPLDDRAVRPADTSYRGPDPHAPPIYLSSVYRCGTPAEAERILGGADDVYVYSRYGHPNAKHLSHCLADLHGAEHAEIAGSGMAAMATALVAALKAGDHVLLQRPVYGMTSRLLERQLKRLGIEHSFVDATDADAVGWSFRRNTRLLLVETIGNPLLQVVDIELLARLAHERDSLMMVDNTFATAMLCRPLTLGADLVVESLTKLANGHGDVLLGAVMCSREWESRVHEAAATWGFAAAPFDCWLALRGLGTLHLRAERACQNALAAAHWLAEREEVAAVSYPGLASHPQHEIARRQFPGRYGHMVTFELTGGLPAAERFIAAARQIPFCPSLGELDTTLSHPTSTSHRGLTPEQREKLGISEGHIRLSLGCENTEHVLEALNEGFAGV